MTTIRYNGSSMYARTPIRGRFLDIWQPIDIGASINDTVYSIPAKYQFRPDLAAYELFGDVNLWYVFGLRNKDVLIDPIYDFVEGLEIFVPARENFQG